MTAPSPAPGQHIEVNRDTVLAARAVILRAADDAKAKLAALRENLVIRPPAEDKISLAASAVWNANLIDKPDSHYNKLMQYVASVEELAAQLEAAAKEYGYTDEEIAASLHSHARHA